MHKTLRLNHTMPNLRIARRIAAAACLLALGACNFAPTYQRPDAPIPAQWPDGAPGVGTREVATLEMETFFPDARLRALIGTALSNNRDLRVATARVAEARALYGVQSADRLPTVNLGADRIAARTPADLSVAGRALNTQRYDVNLGVTAFELDFWGRVKNLSDATLAAYLGTEEAWRSFRLSLTADVADAYLTQREMAERTQLALETLAGREKVRDLVVRRRDAGVSSNLDYVQAEGAVQAARVELASLQRQQASATHALRLLVGGDTPGLPTGSVLADQGLVPDLAAGVPSEVLLRRPDVAAAELQLKAANAVIGAARAAFFPRIALTGTYGTSSASLGGLFESGSQAWTFQPVLSLPLFDAGRVRAGVDMAEARRNLAVAQYEKVVQQAFREVSDLLVAREKLREQLAAQRESESLQRERLRLVEARYNGGIANHLELLDAQRDAFSAQQARVQVQRLLLSAYAQLYKALGGSDSYRTATP